MKPAAARTSAPDSELPAKIEEVKARKLLLWKYTFTPSHELSAKGISVSSVREQLSSVGEILKNRIPGQGTGRTLF